MDAPKKVKDAKEIREMYREDKTGTACIEFGGVVSLERSYRTREVVVAMSQR